MAHKTNLAWLRYLSMLWNQRPFKFDYTAFNGGITELMASITDMLNEPTK